MEGEKEKEGSLPPGFRFHPTDEELVTYYLVNKISNAEFTAKAIADVDLNKSEPWDLPGKAKMGGKEWYFFNLRDRKYPTGVRTNRATNTGYWKTTGKDKEIFNGSTSELVGMKKTLVFYKGRAPRGEKTGWVMHEYRTHSKSSSRTSKQDEWVVCRVFKKSEGTKKYTSSSSITHNITRTATPTINPYMNINPNLVPLPLQGMLMNPHDNFNSSSSMAGSSIADSLMGHHQHHHNHHHQQQMMMMMNYHFGNHSNSGINLNLGGEVVQPVLVAADAEVAEDTAFHEENAAAFGVENCVDLDGYWPSY